MNGIVGPNVAVWFHLGPLALTGYYLHPVRIHRVWAFVGSAQWSGGPNLFIKGAVWPPSQAAISDHTGSLVLFLKGRRKPRCNEQLHTCQTVPRFPIPERPSIKYIQIYAVSWLSWLRIWHFFTYYTYIILQKKMCLYIQGLHQLFVCNILQSRKPIFVTLKGAFGFTVSLINEMKL